MEKILAQEYIDIKLKENKLKTVIGNEFETDTAPVQWFGGYVKVQGKV